MPRPPSPHAHAHLLRAARTAFARDGVEHARIEDIAKAAKVSKGAFYLHFSSKEQVFRELVEQLLATLEEATAQRQGRESAFVADFGALTAEDFRGGTPRLGAFMTLQTELTRDLLSLLVRHREVLRAIDGAAGAPYRQLVTDFRTRMTAQVVGDVSRQLAEGQIRAGLDAKALTDHLIGAFDSFILRLAGDDETFDVDAWSRTHVSLLFHGILPAATPAAPAPARRPRRRS